MRSGVAILIGVAVLLQAHFPAVADEAEAKIWHEKRPDIFAGFDDKMAEENAGRESGDIEFPIDWETYNDLEAMAREEVAERDIESQRARFFSGELGGVPGASMPPKLEQAMRAREVKTSKQIHERVGPPPSMVELQRERDLLFSSHPELPRPGLTTPEHPGGILFPTPLQGGGRYGVEPTLQLIDEQQDILQDLEDESNPTAYGKARSETFRPRSGKSYAARMYRVAGR